MVRRHEKHLPLGAASSSFGASKPLGSPSQSPIRQITVIHSKFREAFAWQEEWHPGSHLSNFTIRVHPNLHVLIIVVMLASKGVLRVVNESAAAKPKAAHLLAIPEIVLIDCVPTALPCGEEDWGIISEIGTGAICFCLRRPEGVECMKSDYTISEDQIAYAEQGKIL